MDTEAIFAIAERTQAASVLATVIGVQGHSYRKAGASMLLAEGGWTVGSISPGCLEADLADRIGEVLAENRYAIADYNLRPEEDAVWGEEIGCDGTLRILLEPLTDDLCRALGEVVRAVRGGMAARLVRREAGGGIGYEVKLAAIVDGCRPDAGGASDSLYESLHLPRERLVIFGAGEEAVAVDELARGVGFRTVVADWRPALCDPRRFPAAETIVGDADAIVAGLNVAARDFVMLASHNLRRDREMYARIVPFGPAYLGIVGSTSRIGKLLEGKIPPPFVRAPIGLPIGAEGAKEIAVSVTAELIACRNRLRVFAGGRREA
ncbi:XdhC family protein [Cohnella sp. REN36]|uniref:XdhC family protein n=1 Tax=Cohnella sp. REN36 TaxID=2887347 RepID=UPI001D1420A8|nr:XdhC/CoxI family protein [Cohnella sp. REN36]MCC3372676.1 XdhC family protein [Cohnella sp. REN36]